MQCATSDWYVIKENGEYKVERYTVLQAMDTLDALRLSRCRCGRHFVEDTRDSTGRCGACG